MKYSSDSTGNHLQDEINTIFNEQTTSKKAGKIRVLIAEDDSDIQEVLIFQLTEAGYEVILAKDGQEAVKKAEFYHPNVILMDIHMPKLNGIEACRLIKENNNISLQNIPILMLTAQNSKQDVAQSAQAKADGYIIKPFSIEYVIERIEEVLKKYSILNKECTNLER